MRDMKPKHYIPPYRDGHYACGAPWGVSNKWSTPYSDEVTCGNCKRTKVYRKALLDKLPGKEKPAPKAGSEETKDPLEFNYTFEVSVTPRYGCSEDLLKILEDLIENGASE